MEIQILQPMGFTSKTLYPRMSQNGIDLLSEYFNRRKKSENQTRSNK